MNLVVAHFQTLSVVLITFIVVQVVTVAILEKENALNRESLQEIFYSNH